MVSESKFPKANRQIKAHEVRLVNDNGDMLGVVSLNEALDLAREKGLDLVEISPNATPPVCKLLDFGKYKYQLQKKEHDNRKKQKVVSIKEIKLRPTIDDHDFDVKMRSIEKFIKAGDKVKISIKFRGREITHSEFGTKLLERIKEAAAEIAKAELEPRMEGKQMLMILVPKVG